MKKVWHEMIAFFKLISAGNRKAAPVLVLGGLTKAILPFIGLFFSARILNDMIAGAFQSCIKNTAILLLSQLAVGMAEKACRQSVDALSENCERSVKERMAAKAFELEYEEFEKQETMDTIRRANVSALGEGGVGAQVLMLYDLFEEVCSIICSLVYIVLLFLQVDKGSYHFFTSYEATIILLLIYGVILWLNRKIGERNQQVFSRMAGENDHGNSVFNYLSGIIMDEKNAKDIRVLQMQEAFDEKYREMVDKCLGIFLKTGQETGKNMGLAGFINQIAAGIAYIFVGAKALYGVISIGDVLLYAGAINQAVDVLVRFLSDIYEFSYRADYLKTFAEFINRPAMSYDGTLPIEKRDDARYEFAFHDVSFHYPGNEKAVLSHINLKFTIGEKLAVVGRNGAGKTTLIKLLCRLYEPTDGYITLNGIDIRKYNYKEYVNVFSVIFQDFKIFSLPLDENVASGKEVDEERIWKVLEEVSLKERVSQMKDGIRSKLYNNNGEGIDISGGEAQRLAIARALYKDAPFVIMDEPTAALDPIAEAEIYQNFNRIIAGKTTIYISHRMSSCKFCDRIVVLDGGVIAESGTHEALIKREGIYAGLYKMQAQHYT